MTNSNFYAQNSMLHNIGTISSVLTVEIDV